VFRRHYFIAAIEQGGHYRCCTVTVSRSYPLIFAGDLFKEVTDRVATHWAVDRSQLAFIAFNRI